MLPVLLGAAALASAALLGEQYSRESYGAGAGTGSYDQDYAHKILGFLSAQANGSGLKVHVRTDPPYGREASLATKGAFVLRIPVPAEGPPPAALAALVQKYQAHLEQKFPGVYNLTLNFADDGIAGPHYRVKIGPKGS